MGTKWTDGQREKFKATMKKIHAEKTRKKLEKARQAKAKAKALVISKRNGADAMHPELLPAIDVSAVRVEVSRNDTEDFARYMAAGWRAYHGQ